MSSRLAGKRVVIVGAGQTRNTSGIVDIHVVGTGSALRGAVICFYLSNEGLSIMVPLSRPLKQKLS